MRPVTSFDTGTDLGGDVAADTGTHTPLSGYTTLRLGGPADRFVSVDRSTDLVDAVRAADAAGDPLLLLGGGSNLVVADEGFAGTVVRIATAGCGFDRLRDGLVQLTAEAGEPWDDVVARTVAEDLGGLECLSGIPGLVGATPVQNVGAYGVEIAESLISVDLMDRRGGQVRTVRAEALGLYDPTARVESARAASADRFRRVQGLGQRFRPARPAAGPAVFQDKSR